MAVVLVSAIQFRSSVTVLIAEFFKASFNKLPTFLRINKESKIKLCSLQIFTNFDELKNAIVISMVILLELCCLPHLETDQICNR